MWDAIESAGNESIIEFFVWNNCQVINRGFQKPKKISESETGQEDRGNRNSAILEINSPYWCGLTKDQMDSWGIYGVTTDNLPTQAKMGGPMGCLSRKRK